MYNELLEMIYKRSVRQDRSVATVCVWRRNAPRPDVINWSSLSVGTHFRNTLPGKAADEDREIPSVGANTFLLDCNRQLSAQSCSLTSV